MGLTLSTIHPRALLDSYWNTAINDSTSVCWDYITVPGVHQGNMVIPLDNSCDLLVVVMSAKNCYSVVWILQPTTSLHSLRLARMPLPHPIPLAKLRQLFV